MKTIVRKRRRLALSLGIIAMLLVSLGYVVVSIHAGMQATFYVATNGNDNNPGTLARPFLTIQKAQAEVRQQLATGQTGDLEVVLRTGKYYQSSTISFNERDSGRSGHRVVYRNYPDERPEIVAGQPVTGWVLHSGNIYKAHVGTGRKFYRLYENGSWSVMARHPNTGWLIPKAATLSSVSYEAGELPVSFDYTNAQVNYDTCQWLSSMVPIQSVNSSTRTISLEPANIHDPCDDPKYYVQGSHAFLDAPGEFHLDESTGTLYYWPKAIPIADQTIIAPTTKRAVEFRGSGHASLIRNVVFEGIHVSSSDFISTFTRTQIDGGDDIGREGLVFLENASNITVRFCRLTNAGFSAVEVNGYAQNNTVYGNWIERAGYNGIYLDGFEPKYGDVNRFNLVSNNKIYDTALTMVHGKAIEVYQSGDNEISHNEIRDIGWGGIVMRGFQAGTDENYIQKSLFVRRNVVKFNDIAGFPRHADDVGGIYTMGIGDGNVIYNNRVHDFHQADHLVVGIYLDAFSRGVMIKNNIVYGGSGDQMTPMLVTGYNNVITNNILADNQPSTYADILDQAFGHRHDNNTYTRNILYRAGGKAIYWFNDYVDSALQTNTIDYNVYWHPDGRYDIWGVGNQTWTHFRSLYGNKFDQHSVIADPVFRDAANHDYTVRSDSPALARGFMNINQADIGLKSDFPVF
jgi:Right handed beta helix region